MASSKATARSRKRPTTDGTRRAANQRADAQRNRARILAAAVTAIRRTPDASVADIAAEAGVGRVTLYGHFQTRAELVEATLVDSLERGEEVLREVPLEGDAREVFQRLVASSWVLVEQSRVLLAAAQRELPAERIRELHEKAEARMRGLLERGQQEGVFRADLPVSWLLTTTHVVMNGAAQEVRAGRLDPRDAPRFIDAILLPAFTHGAAPATPVATRAAPPEEPR